jgi:hypothetical protein
MASIVAIWHADNGLEMTYIVAFVVSVRYRKHQAKVHEAVLK